MSKNLNKLNNIQKGGNCPESQAIGLRESALSEAKNLRTEKTVPKGLSAKTHNASIFGIFVALMFFVMLVFNIKIFNILKAGTFEKNEILAKTVKIEDRLKDYSEQISANYEVMKKYTNILEKLNSEIKAANSRIAELEKQNDSHRFTIENLTKAKNALYNRVSSLEAGLENANNSKTPKNK